MIQQQAQQNNNFMSKNATPIILLILALGTYFTFTRGKVEELKAIKKVNAGYQQAINNSAKLMKVRDEIKRDLAKIDPNDLTKIEKMVPNNIDNVRLTLDVKSIGLTRGLILKNVKTDAPNMNTALKQAGSASANKSPAPVTQAPGPNGPNSINSAYDTVVLSFSVTTDYQTFLELLRDLETSLRIIDVSKISFTATDSGIYDYNVELKTYWLKQ
jgi:Tfp pilus assembly protein PilO